MVTSRVKYTGGLHTEAEHLQSGAKIVSDAPRDNFGKGEAFSPTDTVATALASCMLTTMGIVGQRDGHTPIDGCEAEVTKVMYQDPRRIGEVHVKITMPARSFSEKERKIYENTAHTCPVARSLHPDLRQVVEFVWQ